MASPRFTHRSICDSGSYAQGCGLLPEVTVGGERVYTPGVGITVVPGGGGLGGGNVQPPAPGLPEVVVSAPRSGGRRPARESSAPLPVVVVPAPVFGGAPSEPTTEFERLLGKAPSYKPPPLSAEFDRLVFGDYLTDFERLIQQPFIPKETATAFEGLPASLLGRLLSGVATGLSLLLYSQEAGASNEPELVQEFLNAYGVRGPPSEPPPAPVASDTGLPEPDRAAAPEPPLPTIVVRASRTSPAVLADPVLQGTALDLGVQPLLGAQPNTEPTPRRAPAPAPRPQALPAPLSQLEGLTQPVPGRPARAGQPEAQPSPLAAALPQTGTRPSGVDCQSDKQRKNKKKRKQRDVCYRGTYEERRDGLLKFRQVQIPCK